jgi:hypothetical protein
MSLPDAALTGMAERELRSGFHAWRRCGVRERW